MRLIPVCLFMFMLTLRAHAQTSSASTSAPAGPDLGSPRAALTAAYSALRAGDIPTAKACLLFNDARHAELFEITYTQLYTPFKLMHALEGRFGPAGRTPFANAALEKSLEALLENIQHEEFTVDGATAVAAEKKAAINPSAETELTGITLKNEGDAAHPRWKIVATTFGDATSDLPASQLQMMRTMAAAVRTATDATLARLGHGDFKSADEAYADYQARMQQAMRAAPASLPK